MKKARWDGTWQARLVVGAEPGEWFECKVSQLQQDSKNKTTRVEIECPPGTFPEGIQLVRQDNNECYFVFPEFSTAKQECLHVEGVLVGFDDLNRKDVRMQVLSAHIYNVWDFTHPIELESFTFGDFSCKIEAVQHSDIGFPDSSDTFEPINSHNLTLCRIDHKPFSIYEGRSALDFVETLLSGLLAETQQIAIGEVIGKTGSKITFRDRSLVCDFPARWVEWPLRPAPGWLAKFASNLHTLWEDRGAKSAIKLGVRFMISTSIFGRNPRSFEERVLLGQTALEIFAALVCVDTAQILPREKFDSSLNFQDRLYMMLSVQGVSNVLPDIYDQNYTTKQGKRLLPGEAFKEVRDSLVHPKPGRLNPRTVNLCRSAAVWAGGMCYHSFLWICGFEGRLENRHGNLSTELGWYGEFPTNAYLINGSS